MGDNYSKRTVNNKINNYKWKLTIYFLDSFIFKVTVINIGLKYIFNKEEGLIINVIVQLIRYVIYIYSFWAEYSFL